MSAKRVKSRVNSSTIDTSISIKGARLHNLKSINLNIPRDALVVITGVSGSGKSSLAFDTIYAEGQRRYIESLSSYARQFLDQMQKPDVDVIAGLPPTIAIEQRTSHSGPRSTVATTTEIYDYLRLLFAKVGTPYCFNCGIAITRQNVDQILKKVTLIPEGSKIIILAPVIKSKKGEHKEVFQTIRRKGFVRVRVDGITEDLNREIKLSRYKIHNIEIVVDRLIVKEDFRKRLYDSIITGLELGDGVVIVSREKGKKWDDIIFSERYSCLQCGLGYEEPAPRMFSFNSPYGACKECEGLGVITEDDSDLDRPDEGTADYHMCDACNGARLRPEALAVKIEGKSIHEVTEMTVEKAFSFFQSVQFESNREIIAKGILKEILIRLKFMLDIGLYYLTLERRSNSLSGGEVQRIRLSTQVGTGLTGACYVLDEPTIGLHQRDNDKLIHTLKKMKALGNTVIIVEHDETTIRNADYVVDLGPGAGEHGGSIVAEGSVEDIISCKESLTAQYLTHKLKIEIPQTRKTVDMDNSIVIKGARENNLKSIDVTIPLRLFCCITGLSGSGKSTLVNHLLHKALMKELYGSRQKPGKFKEILGAEKIDKVIEIDQSPIGRTPRSNPATYTNLFNHIRNILAQTKESKMRGYTPARYSFNVKGGRCELCGGQGTKRVSMHFLPDMFIECEQCRGKRYNAETLEITYKGKSISDILDLSVDEAYDFFKNIPSIERILRTLHEVGLGYITLGQSSTTISGGEAQRVKLSTELAKQSTGKTLYILDEPTTGLHFADIHNLLKILHRLTDRGNTVVVIEHNLDVIKTADYIIDMGPEGGDRGGKVVACGTPEEVAASKRSYTGMYLKRELSSHNKEKK
ncbi:MAG: excinuclease ABC subunit A [Candidatus Scalindua sp. AMX11]|nr:MAG: excinuclease ABC subunit A [Candidatus Scalindua sp.]NOG85437.1 excinuclease ABC subunit UvrA [Planctomycetota bacterium]RZV84028.1 MAG: excinuclease ABC subunit A [Candidatus Scalindua sp. SCAELEC01]TDE65687.1 MAG: excinuclease ABC subunit A [Candidatus Scalindua sp. AMX11]GJQ58827.1 MAG: UvrABC system protein A [Candidatus Scalindua sp.]